MLEHTTPLTTKLSPSTSITGHLFLTSTVAEHLTLTSVSKFDVQDLEVHNLVTKISAVECNPIRTLGALAFADVSKDLASACLSISPDHEPKGIANGHREERIVVLKLGI
jgi:hypothetical protein